MPNIHHEMSCAERVRTIRSTCGTNETVVIVAAAKPIASVAVSIATQPPSAARAAAAAARTRAGAVPPG